jgi:predicted AAA+ superfamily ATPase
MYKRDLSAKISQALTKYKIVTLTGPRQSGKTTLAKHVGSGFSYFNLEDLDFLYRVREDPKSFFDSIKSDVIIDEVQKWPEILSYLQVYTDRDDFSYRFILTGSNSLLLSQNISQSLAGRTRIFQILPLAYKELPPELRPQTISEAIYRGLYPRIYAKDLNPTEWIGDYLQTYVEKDVRQLLNVENHMLFDRFLRLLAGRIGQLVNYTSLASEVGVSVGTIKNWISILKASFVLFELMPHHKNFNKRITKASKIYFYDTGIVSYLLRIMEPSHLDFHPLRGQLFENWVIVEKIKHQFNQGMMSSYYFWRDQHGHEIDLVDDRGTYLYLSEIKSSVTFNPDFFKNIDWLNTLQGRTDGELIYGGSENFRFKDFQITSWKNLY